MAQEHGTGFIPLSPDDYAKQPHAVRARSATFLSSVDLSPYFPEPRDQSFQGSCTAWAVSYAARSYYLAAFTGHKPTSDSDISSPAYVFNASTSKPSKSGVLCGAATMVDALNVVKTQGTTSWQHMPYNPSTCLPAPTAQDQALAAGWKMPGYESIPAASLKSPDAYREMLEHGKPVIIGAMINHTEWLHNMPNTPVVWTLQPDSVGSGPNYTGHAMVVVGYDDNRVAANGERGAFRLMNSWGKGWGDHGFLWISYKSLMALVIEAYVFKDAVPPMIPHDGVFAPVAAQGLSPTPVVAQVPVSPPPVTQTPSVAPTPVAPPPPPQPAVLPDLTTDLQTLAANFKTGEVKVEPDGQNYRLTGYGCVDEVRYLRAVVGKYGQRVSVDVDETPWPACEIRGILKDAVARPGVDAHVVNLAPDAPPLARGVQITEVDAPVTTTAILRNGDPFEIDTEVQDQAPYVQIYYLQADQSVKEIWRGEVKPGGDGRRRLSIGGADSKIKLTASRPYGTEAVLVLAGQGVMSPATMPHNTSETGFMDRLRTDLGQAVITDPSIRAQIVQVEVRDNPNPSDAWLITPSELDSFGGVPDVVPQQPVVSLGDFWGPRIVVDPATLNVKGGRLMIKAAFNQGWGSTIQPDSARVLYRTQVGWRDVTDRVKAAGSITAAGINTSALSLPAGRHTLRISVADARGHQGIVELNFTTGES